MTANPISNFHNFYHLNPDPYPDAATFYTPFRADLAVLLGTIINSLKSCTYHVTDGKHKPLATSCRGTLLTGHGVAGCCQHCKQVCLCW